jgi:Stress responsive A/B Barrel Domain
MMTKRTIFAVCAVLIVAAAFLLAAPMKPKSVVHVITVQWKSDATPEQIAKAIKGVESMNYPGLKNVWTRPIKMQLAEGYKSIFVMEFESEQALQNYADSPAQKAWYELYMPIREESRTSDITN